MAPGATADRTSKRRPGRSVRAVATAFLAGLAACAQSGPPVSTEQVVIGADESPLVFADIQETPLRGRFYELNTNNRRTKGVIGVWAGRDKYPHGRIVYIYLAPGYYYPGQHTANDYLDSLKLGNTTEFMRGEDGRMVNALGRVEYRRFKAEQSECVVFSQTFGATEWGTGNKIVSGHYCQPPQRKLDDDTIARILNGIGIRDVAVPEQVARRQNPLDHTPEKIRFTGTWENRYETLDGEFVATDVLQNYGKMLVELPGNGGECVGEWRFDAGAPSERGRSGGNWSAVCTNGLKVDGTYWLTKSKGGAEGKDQDGNAVRITFDIPLPNS
jgi:hypothetical protein